MKAVVAAFNQEKALVGAFSVITNLRMQHFEALVFTPQHVAGGHCMNHPVLCNYVATSHQHQPGPAKVTLLQAALVTVVTSAQHCSWLEPQLELTIEPL